MKPSGKNSDGLDGEARRLALARLQAYFRAERDEELGDLAAGLLLDFIAKELGPAFYNQGVRDAKALVLKGFAGLDEELDLLEKLPPKGAR